MNELKRIQVLEEYDILDSAPEKEFNEIIELASALFDAPISFISLIETERQWFKAIKGLSVTEAERKHAFCNYTIVQPEGAFVINDTEKDPRFSSNPYVVDDPNIRFYAGVALVTEEGLPIGTMCVIDRKPRDFSDKEVELLKTISQRIMVLLKLRKDNLKNQRELSLTKSELDRTLNRLIEAQTIARIGSWDWDIVSNTLYWSPEMYAIYGVPFEEENILDVWMTKVHPEDRDVVKETLLRGLKDNKNATFEYRIIDEEGQELWLETIGNVRTNQGVVIGMSGTVQEVTKRKQAEIKKNLYLETLEEMMFDLSHTIRQPLANSIGLVDAFKSYDLSDRDVKKLVDFLRISVNKVDEHIREMSDYIHNSKEEISN